MGKVHLSRSIAPAAYGMEGCFGGWSTYSRTYGDGWFSWYNCREEFHEDCPQPSTFLYWTSSGRQVIAYIHKAEDMLGLKGKERCVISPTNLDNIYHVQVGSFWKRPLRLSLLTILFRDGRQYEPRRRNFWPTAERSPYLGEDRDWGTAMYAFRKFMAGHVNFNYHEMKCERNGEWYDAYYGYDYDVGKFKLDLRQGWIVNFGYINKDTIDKLLLKPRRKSADRKRTQIRASQSQGCRKPVRRCR